MTPFTFQTTPTVICAPGATEGMGALLAARGLRRAAFITDATVLGLGLAEPALAGLRAAGVATWVFAEVTPDRPRRWCCAPLQPRGPRGSTPSSRSAAAASSTPPS